MGQVTHEQASLLLRLYELRREPRMREARNWFATSFDAKNREEFMQRYPMGTDANASYRMVTTYWEMVASLVNRGLIDDELFFENGGEARFVWERIRELVMESRAAMKNPHAYGQLEALAGRMEQWQEKRAPGSNAVMRQMMAAASRPATAQR